MKLFIILLFKLVISHWIRKGLKQSIFIHMQCICEVCNFLVYSVQCSVWSAQGPVCSMKCIVLNVQYKVHSVQCGLNCSTVCVVQLKYFITMSDTVWHCLPSGTNSFLLQHLTVASKVEADNCYTVVRQCPVNSVSAVYVTCYVCWLTMCIINCVIMWVVCCLQKAQ